MNLANLIQIENRSGKVKLNETVTKQSAERLVEEMDRLYGVKAVIENMRVGEHYANATDALETLDIEIHSPGGSVFDGWRMHQAIRAMRDRGVKVTATINSVAASMATVVAIAADEVRIVKGGRMMIHDASTIAMGNAADLRKVADKLEVTSDEIAQAYADKTGRDKEEMRALMAAETWLTASESVKIGLADTVLDGEKVDTPPKAMALKDIFSPNADLQAQVEALTADNASHEAAILARDEQIAQLQTDIEALDARLADLSEQIANRETLISEQEAKIAELQAVADRVPELEKVAAVTPEKISEQAALLLASQGHQPVEISGESSGPAPDILQQLAELKGDERTKFFKANHKAIKAALRG